jgi:hypothetical protein
MFYKIFKLIMVTITNIIIVVMKFNENDLSHFYTENLFIYLQNIFLNQAVFKNLFK